MIYRGPVFLSVIWFGSESIEWFKEDHAFYRSYTFGSSSPSPLFMSASCLSFSVFMCFGGGAYWWERGGKGLERSQIIQRRESLVLYNSFIIIWFGSFLTPPPPSPVGKLDRRRHTRRLRQLAAWKRGKGGGAKTARKPGPLKIINTLWLHPSLSPPPLPC